MHVLERLERLPGDVLLVDVLQDVGADGGVQVRLHDLEDEVDVAVVVGLEAVDQRDDVLVPRHLLPRCRGELQRRAAEERCRVGNVTLEQSTAAQGRRGEARVRLEVRPEVRREVRPEARPVGSGHLEEHDLAEGALGVGGVLKGIEYLLECHHLTGLLVHGAPHDAIGSLAKLLDDVVLPQHVPVDLVRPAGVSWAWEAGTGANPQEVRATFEEADRAGRQRHAHRNAGPSCCQLQGGL